MKTWEMPEVQELAIEETACHPWDNKYCDTPQDCDICGPWLDKLS